MPKLGGMAQLSRPYQIALAVLGLLAVVWVVALRPHSSSPSSSSTAPATATQTPTASQAAPAKSSAGAQGVPSSVYHGSAPGVQGLTRAIAKAHGAVATSEQNAKQLDERSAQASSPTPSNSANTSSSAANPAPSTSSATKAPSATASTPAPAAKHPIKSQSGSGRLPARQVLVEKALKEGKVAVILFWNPKGSDDVAVRDELRLLEAVHHIIRPVARTPQIRHILEISHVELQKPFAAFEASAKQVAEFGSITRGVQVYGTPTLLIVGKSGKTTVLTGLTDYYSIEQAIDETRHG
jgi:hypothetical protein